VKVLVDECCPKSVVEGLRQDNHEVEYVATDFAGLQDLDILEHSVQEQQIIVTEDRDFCEMVSRDAQPAYGIMLIRIAPKDRHEKPARVRYLFTHHADDLPHAMTTLTRDHIRTRPLPTAPGTE
jgi:predicted nuclease of predicted toxin-antitoxin system